MDTEKPDMRVSMTEEEMGTLKYWLLAYVTTNLRDGGKDGELFPAALDALLKNFTPALGER
jgi:hypothetical protein